MAAVDGYREKPKHLVSNKSHTRQEAAQKKSNALIMVVELCM